MSKSVLSNCIKKRSNWYCFCASSRRLTSVAAVKKRTRRLCRQAAKPSAMARCVLPVPALPMKQQLARWSSHSPRASSRIFGLLKAGIQEKS